MFDLKAQREAQAEHNAHEKFISSLPDQKDIAVMDLDDSWLEEAVVF